MDAGNSEAYMSIIASTQLRVADEAASLWKKTPGRHSGTSANGKQDTNSTWSIHFHTRGAVFVMRHFPSLREFHSWQSPT
jgi:hypothetical protein